jgi:FtsZ-binding cell division protein ZapB
VCEREDKINTHEGTRHLVGRRRRWQEKIKGLLGRGSSIPGRKAAGT